jgi:hypothetical protein
MKRNASQGMYRNYALHFIVDEDKVKKDESGNYPYKTKVPIDGEDDFFVDVGESFKFKYSEGEGLTKDELALFNGWLVQDTNDVIETFEAIDFNKGERIQIDGANNLIEKTIKRRNTSRQLRGNKQRSESFKKWIFIG